MASSPEYMREYRKRYRKSVHGKSVLRNANKRWKQSDNGKRYNREWAKSKYIPSKRVSLTPEERAARNKESFKRSLSKPHVRAKRVRTAWIRWLKVKYGLSLEAFEAMSANGCNICGSKPERKLHVDHDHKTGKVRGVLCDPCNRGIGCFGDNAVKLTLAAGYLIRTA